MPTAAACNACNVVFIDDAQKRIHYRSEWHRYNLKRKVARVPGVTEALFSAWEAAHEQHLSSRLGSHQEPLPVRSTVLVEEDGAEEPAGESTSKSILQVNEETTDPSCCFMCDLEHGTADDCMVHLHRKHGFFVPDSEYLKDPGGFLTFVGHKVKRDFICLYCDDRRRPFQSLEAVRKHMDAKGHCKVRYGDVGDDEDADLEDFYDYSSSYADADGKQLAAAAADGGNRGIELGIGGSELVITYKSEKGTRVVRALGSREFIRYYRQNPRPSPVAPHAIIQQVSQKEKGSASPHPVQHAFVFPPS